MMTRDDFEAIMSIDAVKHGKVRIELRYLGFTFIASRRARRVEHVVTYLEANEARYPVALFYDAVQLVQQKLIFGDVTD